jgi:peroxiredoxin
VHKSLTFDILTDLHLQTAEQFRLVFVLPDCLRDLYKSFASTLDRFHDESEYRLPMPARYVIDRQGTIRSADVNADYTVRPLSMKMGLRMSKDRNRNGGETPNINLTRPTMTNL